MMRNRKQLKNIKKDIVEQIEAGIEIEDLHIPEWFTGGDGVFEGRAEKMMFEGRITKAESLGSKVVKANDLLISVMEIDGEVDVEFSVFCMVEDEEGYRDEESITLNI